MSGIVGARVAPLRTDDPERLGQYRMLGRLGQGGMGTVYLAEDARGRHVAVKVVRADLAADDEFRLRFRSEVHRARQVPPFCTAEVLDADPDHQYPYLVVEYVDGPSLADVVEERGPLSPANLHALAIGVATALTAIHGAGVVHRDLKPRNVLLAPGSPKVIDFGIARAMESTSQLTGTRQMLGTVAYMAPERFDTDVPTPLGPPSDVFAWGAVIAYAGTGRTPFHGDSPPATAARILTQPPELGGLPPQLRGLVEMTLAKDAQDRPTARELLDLLLGSGPQADTAQAALHWQPELSDAALGARAASDERRMTTYARSHRATPGRGTGAARGRRRGARTKAVVAAAMAVALAAVGVPYLMSRFAGQVPASQSADSPASASPSTAPSPSPSTVAPPLVVNLRDDLTEEGRFKELEIPEAFCTFRGGSYFVQLQKPGSIRCPGPPDLMIGDRTFAVEVVLGRTGSCAAIWFVSTPEDGYAMNICPDAALLDLHRGGSIERVGATSLPSRLPFGKAVQVTLRVVGPAVALLVDGDVVAEMPVNATDLLARPTDITLGVYGVEPEKPPYQVRFRNLEVQSGN